MRLFEIQYTYELDPAEFRKELNLNKALAIDVELNNLVTAVTNTGESFIIDGRRLKSINQRCNKKNCRLQSIKALETTEKQSILWNNRNAKVNDYINKTCRIIINYFLETILGI